MRRRSCQQARFESGNCMGTRSDNLPTQHRLEDGLQTIRVILSRLQETLCIALSSMQCTIVFTQVCMKTQRFCTVIERQRIAKRYRIRYGLGRNHIHKSGTKQCLVPFSLTASVFLDFLFLLRFWLFRMLRILRIRAGRIGSGRFGGSYR